MVVGKSNNTGECSRRATYRDLLQASAKAAHNLTRMGLVVGDRIVLILAPTLEGVYWIEAAKRLGIIYACVPSTLPAQSLADRI